MSQASGLLFVAVLVLVGCAVGGREKAAASEPPSTPAVDKKLAVTEAGQPTLWHDLRAVGLEGQGWTDTKSPYDRLPAKAEAIVRPPVWDLSHHSAGICACFVTDATTISARWKLRFESRAMDHMPATGVSGLDLYAQADGKWHWVGTGVPPSFPMNEQTLVSGLPPGRREYLLYLPLYNGVDSVQLGLAPEATLYQPPPRPPERAKPIVFWGTSITQGGCAARPGMTYAALLGRWLDRPTINLGFSGNGQFEPEMAKLLAELDPCAYVLDCLPNLGPEQVTERTATVVNTLRAAHPNTPILLVENIAYQAGSVVPGVRQAYVSKNVALQQEYRKLLAAGVKQLYYVPGERLLGDDGEATVDGTHATDLGFLRIAQALEPVLKEALHQ